MSTKHTRRRLSRVAAAWPQLLLVGALTAPSQPQQRLDHVNANRTADPGVYRVVPVFERLERVDVVTRREPGARRSLAAGQWAFDARAGRLRVRDEIDVDEIVIVHGERSLPWAWLIGAELDAGSVRVLLGDRLGERGIDFAADSATGKIHFLRTEPCSPDLQYMIDYDLLDDPERPGVGRGGAIGNHRDRAAVRRFLGVPDDAPGGTADMVGTNASPTGDPRVWVLTRPMLSAGLEVAVVARREPTRRRPLARGRDYAYDPENGTIALLHDIDIERDGEILFVRGVPGSRRVFRLGGPLVPESVRVILGAERLTQGVDFRVDAQRGVVTVLDPAIEAADAKFFVTARRAGQQGSVAFGNHDDRELVRRLLSK